MSNHKSLRERLQYLEKKYKCITCTIATGGLGGGAAYLLQDNGGSFQLTENAVPIGPIINLASVVQDNIYKHNQYRTVGASLTLQQMAQVINSGPLITIAEDEIHFFRNNVFQVNQGGPPTRYTDIYVLRNLGKGTYGTGGAITVTRATLRNLGSTNTTVADIEDLASTQFIDLGDVGINDITTAFNAYDFSVTPGEDPIQAQEDGYVLIDVIINGEALQYLFVGAGGAYGTTGTETAVDEDFVLLTDLGQLASTQFIDVGDIGSLTIEDGFNAHDFSIAPGEEPVQDQVNGYVIVDSIMEGTPTQHLFVGAGGFYGVGPGGVETAVALDFLSYTAVVTTPANDVWRNNAGTAPASAYTESIRHDGQVSVNKKLFVGGGSSYGIQNQGSTWLYVRGNQGVDIRAVNPNVGNILLTSTGTFTVPFVTNQTKYNVRAGRLFNDTQINNDFKTIGVEINDTVNFTQKTGTSYYVALRINPTIQDGTTNQHYAIQSLTGKVEFTTDSIEAPGYTIAQINAIGPKAIPTVEWHNANGGSGTGLVYTEENALGAGLGGWRLFNRDAANYGDVGTGGIDFSFSGTPSATRGATGYHAFTRGDNVTALGTYAVAWGNNQSASAYGAIILNGVNNVVSGAASYGICFGEDNTLTGYGAFGHGYLANLSGTFTTGWGWDNNSDGYASMIGGVFNNETAGTIGGNLTWGNNNAPTNLRNCLMVGIALQGTANVGTAYLGTANINTGVAASPGTNPLAPMITIGNGTHTTPAAAPWAASVRSNLLVGLRNGQLLVPSTTIATIDAADPKVLITREWVQASANVSPFQALDEGSGIGYIIRGSNRANYGNVGFGAFDFGYYFADPTQGATGTYSFNLGGEDNVLSGYNATANGYANIGDDSYNTLFGFRNHASDYGSMCFGAGLISKTNMAVVVGTANIDYTFEAAFNEPLHPIFIVGNGAMVAGSPPTTGARSDALTVLRNGKVGIGQDDFGHYADQANAALLHIAGGIYQSAGTVELGTYGAGTNTGTATFMAAFDANGNIIEEALPVGGGTTQTASNGLTKIVEDIQLGGALTKLTAITAATATHRITIAGNATFAEGPMLDVSTTGNIGTAIQGSSNSNGRGVRGSTATGVGVYASSSGAGGIAIFADSISSGNAIYAQAIDGVTIDALRQTASTNTIETVLNLSRATSGTGADGIGQNIRFQSSTSGASSLSNTIISRWSTADNLTRVSQFAIEGVDNAVTAELFNLKGSGLLQLNKYGVGTHTGTPTYMLAVTSAGDIIESPLTNDRIVYVNTSTGNDGTGALGDITLPFLTVNGAHSALPTSAAEKLVLWEMRFLNAATITISEPLDDRNLLLNFGDLVCTVNWGTITGNFTHANSNGNQPFAMIGINTNLNVTGTSGSTLLNIGDVTFKLNSITVNMTNNSFGWFRNSGHVDIEVEDFIIGANMGQTFGTTGAGPNRINLLVKDTLTDAGTTGQSYMTLNNLCVFDINNIVKTGTSSVVFFDGMGLPTVDSLDLTIRGDLSGAGTGTCFATRNAGNGSQTRVHLDGINKSSTTWTFSTSNGDQGDQVWTGSMREGSEGMNVAGNSVNANTTFKDFIGRFATAVTSVNAHNYRFYNCNITCVQHFGLVNSGSTIVLEFHGTNTIFLEDTGTYEVFNNAGVATTVDIYGILYTNEATLGTNVTANNLTPNSF
jgi:hypothetical protein